MCASLHIRHEVKRAGRCRQRCRMPRRRGGGHFGLFEWRGPFPALNGVLVLGKNRGLTCSTTGTPPHSGTPNGAENSQYAPGPVADRAFRFR